MEGFYAQEQVGQNVISKRKDRVISGKVFFPEEEEGELGSYLQISSLEE